LEGLTRMSADSVRGQGGHALRATNCGALTNVNGKIGAHAAHIGGRINTVEGDISIVGASHVDGGILVESYSIARQR
jgi:hypothetical protein